MKTQTTADGFIWALVENRQKAEKAIDNDFQLYALYDEESEGLIEDYWDLNNAFEYDYKVGLELGFESVLKADWQKSGETRSFESWLEDKAESLIN